MLLPLPLLLLELELLLLLLLLLPPLLEPELPLLDLDDAELLRELTRLSEDEAGEEAKDEE